MKKVKVKDRMELERLGFIYTGIFKGQPEIMNKQGDIIFEEVIGKCIEVKQAPKDTGYDYQCKKYFFRKKWLNLHLEENEKKGSSRC
jgi:hypothetical protein